MIIKKDKTKKVLQKIDRMLKSSLSNKKIIKESPRATIVIRSSDSPRSKYFKEELEREKKNLLSWR